MIVDLLKLTVKGDCVDASKALMKAQIEATRGDEGCAMAHVFQSEENPAEFFMLLGWDSQDAIDKHLATAHDIEFRENMDNKMAKEPDFFAWTEI